MTSFLDLTVKGYLFLAFAVVISFSIAAGQDAGFTPSNHTRTLRTKPSELAAWVLFTVLSCGHVEIAVHTLQVCGNV